jgi:nucleotide-binding universal stress UspA family protein
MSNPRFSRILVPLDGSSTAEAVLSHLRRILDRHDSQLVLLQVQPPVPTAPEEDAEKYLRRISFLLTNEGYPARSILRRGQPAETILDIAAEEHATLIAMTTHGRTGAARWLLGSVAEKVLQASTRPVLVTRSFPSTQSRGKLESLPLRNVLVPVDGSRFSLAVLEPLLEFVRAVDAHVRLLHVNEPTPYDGRWDSPDETLKAADQILREACIPASIEQRRGDPGEEILEAAAETDCDLIAMTTHGRSGPSRWVFGSVTAKVLRSAPIPLLVVRQAVTTASHAPETLKQSAP